MPGQPRPLPSKFPCLCRAIYSWGGETKRDLGFVEGDIIEALNAGDGQWWMGRLRRNKTLGLFPSNFVEIIEDPVAVGIRPISRAAERPASRVDRPVSRHERPVSRHHERPISRHERPLSRHDRPASRTGAASPMFEREVERPASRGISPSQTARRKTSPMTMARGNGYREHSYGRTPSPRPPIHRQSQNFVSRVPSPGLPLHPYDEPYAGPPQHHDHTLSRGPPSPGSYHIPRASSPAPSFNQRPHSRAISPSPSIHDQYHQPRAISPARSFLERNPSPMPPDMYAPDQSPPPPAPPPHRYNRDGSPRRYSNGSNNYNEVTPQGSRGPSPLPHRRATPSPLRTAMEDVMTSLEHMITHDDDDDDYGRPGTSHNDLWSPRAFANNFRQSPTKQLRSQTSLGMMPHQDVYDNGDPYNIEAFPTYPEDQRQPRHNSYSERMGEEFRKFRVSHDAIDSPPDEHAPPVPLKDDIQVRPRTAVDKRKLSYDLPEGINSSHTSSSSRPPPSRFPTVKSTSTSSSSNALSESTASTASTALTSKSIMSGISAGGFSATSAGSFNRRKKAFSIIGTPGLGKYGRPATPLSGISGSSATHSSPGPSLLRKSWTKMDPLHDTANPALGGLAIPKQKKTGFLKKIINSAKTTTANARSLTFAQPLPAQPFNNVPDLPTSKSPGPGQPSLYYQSQDWVEVRRDVARANSLSGIEKEERANRCSLNGHRVLAPVEALDEDVEGDEAADGGAVTNPADFSAANLALVDKTARFVNNLPPFTTPESLATMHICRPYRTDIQRLRAIFTWISDKVAWERPSAPLDDMPLEELERMEVRRVIQSRRGSPEEVSNVVFQMCKAVGIQAEVVRGYLKAPGEAINVEQCPRPNHYWNAVVADGEWRMMDCSLASPTHPRRSMYSSVPNANTDFFYFLTPPSKFCWTHVPIDEKQQHMVPHLPTATLLALPVVTPIFFQYGLQMINFDTSLTVTERLEVVQIDFVAPVEIECVAEVEAKGFAIDGNGDVFETGEVIKKRALAQVAWENSMKTYRVKAIVPGDAGHAVLKVYAGNRGLMHSIKDNPHPLAFAIPITHTGENPPYDFIPRHPTPHAQRHDLYITQPQCYHLALNNTFVFSVRQHPASGIPAEQSGQKPAKLALQTPSGKIIRLMKKADTLGADNGMVWESVVKCNERGAWRALVLADRSARWCVYAEWLVQ